MATYNIKNKRMNDIKDFKKDTEFSKEFSDTMSSKKLVDFGKELLKKQSKKETSKDL